MALRDFIVRRRFVQHADRRYTVTAPTVETIAVALYEFGAEMTGCRMAWQNAPELFTPDAVAACMPFFLDDERLAQVLATCVQLDGGSPGQLEACLRQDRPLMVMLLRAGLELADVDRLVGFMGLDLYLESLKAKDAGEDAAAAIGEPPRQDVRPSGPSGFEMLIVGVAERFHVEPASVMKWPAELFISVTHEILPALHPKPEGPDVFGQTADEWAADGVTLTNTPTES
ncbi:MAG TPA: hypothetical protein VGK94_07955 [Candidatus Polarisedimenticolia bacterium]|jgi:hypothetical protein